MSNTVHTLEWQGKNGVIRLEASYQAMLQEKTNNLDGDICYTGKLEIIERASLTAYFNDKQLDSGWNPASWFLVESPVPGVYQIRDVPKIGIQTEMREKVRQFLEDTIAQGTPVSVQAFRLDHEGSPPPMRGKGNYPNGEFQSSICFVAVLHHLLAAKQSSAVSCSRFVQSDMSFRLLLHHRS